MNPKKQIRRSIPAAGLRATSQFDSIQDALELGESREDKMTEALEALIEKAQKINMTEGQMREQRISFVYGNTHIENNRITREMVVDADEKVAEEERTSKEK